MSRVPIVAAGAKAIVFLKTGGKTLGQDADGIKRTDTLTASVAHPTRRSDFDIAIEPGR